MRFTAYGVSRNEGGVLPGPKPARIQMNKIRFRIISDTTGLEAYGSFADCWCGQSGHSDIDGPTLHVKTFSGHAAGSFAQRRIGFGGTKPGDDIDRRFQFDGVDDTKKEIQQFRVNRFDFPRTMVAQDMVDLLERVGNKVSVDAITGCKYFSGMYIVERQGLGFAGQRGD